MSCTFVAFAGLSISLADARARVPFGRVRGPIRRGDLDGTSAKIAIILDGVLGDEALDDAEITRALARGVRIFGGASVGAWLANRFSNAGVEGHGWVYDHYMQGVLDGPDDVAVLFEPVYYERLTVPVVNAAYFLMHEAVNGMISWATASEALAAVRGIPLADRAPEEIARVLAHKAGGCTRRFKRLPDIKRRDANELLSLRVVGRLSSHSED